MIRPRGYPSPIPMCCSRFVVMLWWWADLGSGLLLQVGPWEFLLWLLVGEVDAAAGMFSGGVVGYSIFVDMKQVVVIPE
ncbi:hypothetical protein U1Q18_002430 [Sarracenia purpurea var. burkii]